MPARAANMQATASPTASAYSSSSSLLLPLSQQPATRPHRLSQHTVTSCPAPHAPPVHQQAAVAPPLHCLWHPVQSMGHANRRNHQICVILPPVGEGYCQVPAPAAAAAATTVALGHLQGCRAALAVPPAGLGLLRACFRCCPCACGLLPSVLLRRRVRLQGSGSFPRGDGFNVAAVLQHNV